jgi:hypothetical protein
MALHTRAWQHYDARPKSGSTAPEKTKPKYCVYDKAHEDHLYTQEWVELLCKDLADPSKYEAVVGKKPPQAAPAAGGVRCMCCEQRRALSARCKDADDPVDCTVSLVRLMPRVSCGQISNEK